MLFHSYVNCRIKIQAKRDRTRGAVRGADFVYRLERVRNEFSGVLALKLLKKSGAGNGARNRGKDAGHSYWRFTGGFLAD